MCLFQCLGLFGLIMFHNNYKDKIIVFFCSPWPQDKKFKLIQPLWFHKLVFAFASFC